MPFILLLQLGISLVAAAPPLSASTQPRASLSVRLLQNTSFRRIFLCYISQKMQISHISATKNASMERNFSPSESFRLRARSYPLLLTSISISSLPITRWLEVGSGRLVFIFSSILFYIILVLQSFTSIESNRGAWQRLQGVWHPVPLGEYNQDSQE